MIGDVFLMGKPCSNLSSILTRDFLYQAYCVEQRTILDIARAVGCRNGTIIEQLKTFGLHRAVTKEWLVEHYVECQESVDHIASLLDCTEANVRCYLRNFGIPIRYKSRGSVRNPILNDRAWLYDRYVAQQLPSTAIADELGCAVSSVQRALKRFHIPLRDTGICLRKPGYRSKRAFSHRKRRLILQRDGHQCRWCGSKDDLQIHHIIPSSQRGTNDLDNGITLCGACHYKTYQREIELIPFFQSILAQEPLT